MKFLFPIIILAATTSALPIGSILDASQPPTRQGLTARSQTDDVAGQTNKDAAPPNKDIVPTNKEAIRPNKDVLLTHKDNPPKHEDVLLTSKNVAPLNKDVLPTNKDGSQTNKNFGYKDHEKPTNPDCPGNGAGPCPVPKIAPPPHQHCEDFSLPQCQSSPTIDP